MAGYNIYRSTTSGSGYVKLNSSLLTASDYIDPNVSGGTTYYYVVTAVDTGNLESVYSGRGFRCTGQSRHRNRRYLVPMVAGYTGVLIS